MRHAAPAARRPLLSIFLATLIIFPNLLIASPARAMSLRQNPLLLFGSVKNRFGAAAAAAAAVPGARLNLSGNVNSNHTLSGFNYNPPPPAVNGKIAFISQRSVGQEIWTMEADGSNPSRVTLIYGATDPDWSPDGSKIAFTYHNDIFVMNADGTNQTQLTTYAEEDFQPAWSPDGAKLAFCRRDNFGNANIYVMNADGSGQTRLTDNPYNDAFPDWSPDGSKIAYVSEYLTNPPLTRYNIFTISPDGSNRTQITNSATTFEAGSPQWSPDGTKFVYVSGTNTAGGGNEIYLANADGTGEVRLTNDQTDDTSPEWSPDGSKIAFTSYRNGEPEVYVMNADGSGQTNLTNDPAPDYSPSWLAQQPQPATPTPTPDTSADMAVFASTTPAFVPSGANVTYSLGINNNGPASTTGVTVSGLLPPGISVVAFNNSHGACSAAPDPAGGGTNVNCTLGGFDPLASKFISIQTTASGTYYAVLPANFRVNSPSPDNNDSNNVAGTQVTIGGPPVPTPVPAPVVNGRIVYISTQGTTNNEIYTAKPDGSDTRRLTFTATIEHTPVFSPDASQIAFVRQEPGGSNIYVMNADGTNERALTTVASNINVDPAWSPDGRTIAYTSGANIWLRNVHAFADAYRITFNRFGGTYPAWSPDGMHLAFVTQENFGNTDIYITDTGGTNAQGEGMTRLTNNPGRDYAPAWSPDGSRIAFASFGDGTSFNFPDIYAINADGSGQTLLTADNPGNDEDPAWSPDGSRIIFTSNRDGDPNGDLFAINPDGSGLHNLTNRPNVSDLEADWGRGLSSTSNNPLIAVLSGGLGGNSDIFVRRADGSGLRNITNSPGSESEFAWSPDGSRLAFVSQTEVRDELAVTDLYVMNADGSNRLRLTNTPNDYEHQPSWSPDGSRLTFWTYSPLDGPASVSVINADGTNFARLTDNTSSNSEPVWSPVAQEIAFTSSRDGHAEVYLMNADGSNVRRLTTSAPDRIGGNFAPLWSPDGSRLAFNNYVGTIFTGGHLNFSLMNADGSNVFDPVDSPLNERNPSWSPDGSRLAFARDGVGGGSGLYTVKVDGTGLQHFGFDLEQNFAPDWSPDGSRLAFTTYRDPAGSITDLINADGTGRVSLGGNEFYSLNPKWQPLAPPPPSADMTVYASTNITYVSSSGGQVVYSVSVINGGPQAATNITLNGQMHAGVTINSIVNDNGGGSACVSDGVSFNCTFPTVNVNEIKTVSLNATSNAAGTPNAPVTATFNVASDTPDPTPDGNTAIAEFLIAAPPLPTPTPGPVNEAQLAYTRFNQATFQSDIFRQRADGAELLNLTNSPATSETAYFWSPDGTRLAFLLYDYANLTVSSYVMNADGSNLTQLTNVPGEYIGSFIWSPDGSKILFSVFPYANDTPDGQVYVMNADGTGRINVSGSDGFNTDPAWSPDGSRISFMRGHYFPDGSAPTNDLYLANADGSNPIRIAHAAGERDFSAVWSPDGTQLAISRYLADNTNHIYLVRPDGTGVRRLINDAGVETTAPQWSPGGGRLSFSSYGQASGAAIESINADGTSGRRTIYSPPQGGMYYGINGWRWSPDGTRLVFSYIIGEAQGANVCVVNADGTGLRCVGGSDLEYNTDPDWSPDGSRLAFMTRRNGVTAINLIKANGTGRVELIRADVNAPKWRPAAPTATGDTPTGSNVTVTENGVTVTFSNVTTAGETTVTLINPNSLQGIPGEYVINANSLAFEIHTTAAYTGAITIGFNVPGVNNPVTFSTLRVLHGEPPPVPNFVDRTILSPGSPSHNFAARTVYARVTSLSPFVIAERKETIPPVTTATLSAPPNAAGWHKANVNVMLAAADNDGGSGVHSITYAAAGAQVIAGTTTSGSAVSVPITTQGTTTISYRARDINGNVEAVKSITVKLDKTAPAAATSTVNSTPNSSGYYNGLNGAVSVTLSASDLPPSGASGILGFLVSATGALTLAANTFVPVSNPVVQITADGTTTLSYRAVDNAGNTGANASRTLKVDSTAPTTTYTVSSAGKNITLTVGFHDNLSGYAAVNYSVNDGQWQTYTGPFPSSGNFSYTFNGPYHESGSYTVRYYGTDAAGNKETTKTVTFTIPPQAITPTLASVKKNSNGTYTATFGYRNDNPVTFNIAVGASNNFSPGNQNRGQTTAFQTGTVASAFTVTWDGSSLTWKVKGPDGQTRSVIARKP